MAKKRVSAAKRKKLQRKKRLIKCVDYLQRKNFIRYYDDISEATGIKTVTIRGALSLASPFLSANFLDTFLSVYGEIFSSEWLLEGEGKMLRSYPKPETKALSQRWERIAYLMKKEKLSVMEFASALGMNAGSTIYNILSSKAHPKDVTMRRIHQAFPQYSLIWLMEGEGEIKDQEYLKKVEKEREKSNAEAYKVLRTRVFPIIPEATTSSALGGSADADSEGFATMTLPVDQEYKGQYYIFTVRGKSMDDGSVNAILDGDRLLCQEVRRENWEKGLQNRTCPYFVFVTRDEGIFVKTISDQDLEKETIRCHSLNQDYPDIILHLKDILGIFNVVELVGRSLKK